MHGVVPVESGRFASLQTGAGAWSNKLTQAAAACNGLIMINRSTVIGDDLEAGLFKTVEGCFLVASSAYKAVQTDLPQPCICSTPLAHLHRGNWWEIGSGRGEGSGGGTRLNVGPA